MQGKRYKQIYIDLDDTLWDTKGNAERTFRELYHAFDYHKYYSSFEDYYDVYMTKNTLLWQAYSSHKISKDELNRTRFSHPLIEAGVGNDEAVKMGQEFEETMYGVIAKQSGLCPFAKDLLEYLAPQYPLHILSNGWPGLQQKKMDSAGILNYFDKIVLSEDIGVPKPGKEIFHYALSATQCEPKDAIMIGDNWRADIVGAAQIGMDQIYYNPDFNQDIEITPTYSVHDLREVMEIL